MKRRNKHFHVLDFSLIIKIHENGKKKYVMHFAYHVKNFYKIINLKYFVLLNLQYFINKI